MKYHCFPSFIANNLPPSPLAAREIWKVSHESEVFLDMTEISEEIISVMSRNKMCIRDR